MNVTVIMADYTLKELLYKQKRGENHLAFAMYPTLQTSTAFLSICVQVQHHFAFFKILCNREFAFDKPSGEATLWAESRPFPADPAGSFLICSGGYSINGL